MDTKKILIAIAIVGGIYLVFKTKKKVNSGASFFLQSPQARQAQRNLGIPATFNADDIYGDRMY